MKRISQILCAGFLKFLLLVFLGSCSLSPTSSNGTDLPAMAPSEGGAVEPERTLSSPPATLTTETERRETATTMAALTPQEVIETYYRLMNSHQYAEAYQLFSPSSPHLAALDDFVARYQRLSASYELLSLQSWPVFMATRSVGTPIAGKIPIENERCKHFYVEEKVEYPEGQMDAEPSGVYEAGVMVVREVDGWKIMEFGYPVRERCRVYQHYRLRIANTSRFALKDLKIVFPNEQITFEEAPAGETTKYQDVTNGVFSEADYQFEWDGQVIDQAVADGAAVTPLRGSMFTYRIDVDPDGTHQNPIIKLVEITTDYYRGE